MGYKIQKWKLRRREKELIEIGKCFPRNQHSKTGCSLIVGSIPIFCNLILLRSSCPTFPLKGISVYILGKTGGRIETGLSYLFSRNNQLYVIIRLFWWVGKEFYDKLSICVYRFTWGNAEVDKFSFAVSSCEKMIN